MIAAPIMLVPGTNRVLQYVARQLDNLDDVMVFGSANQLLWQARQTPPRVVVTDLQLDDMSGAELAEILPNFAPNARIFICGSAQSPAATHVRSVGAAFIDMDGSTARSVEAVYQALDIAAPPLPSTTDLSKPDVPPYRPTAHADRPAPTPPAPAAQPAQNRPSQALPVVPPESRPAQNRPAQALPVAPAPETRPAPTRPSQALPVVQPPAASEAPPDSGGVMSTLVIQPQQHQVLTRLLDLIAKEVGAQCVLLSDQAGMVLVQAGALPGVVLEMVGPMLATSFSSTNQLARLLQEQRTSASYVHEGDRYDIYAFHISYRVSLIIMFDKRVNPGKLGTVWVYARRAMRQIEQILRL